MLQYYKQTIRDLRNPESEKVREVYKVLLNRGDSAEDFIDHVARHSRLGTAVIQAAMTEVAECLAERLAEVGSVALPGIGTISVAIRPREGRDKGLMDQTKEGFAVKQEKRELNARSIELHHLNFRPAKALFDDVHHRLSAEGKLEMIGGKEGVPLYQPHQESRRDRFAAAREYIQEHGFMRVADYSELTNLSRSKAQRELRLASELTHSGIIASGKGSHRIYILAPKPTPTDEQG
ncbi:MAG: HU family DNA-binding protein [Bacteroidaceae bacterium]|nr:HU family DNA-binding protein [Bacteroidaceae bacterium]